MKSLILLLCRDIEMVNEMVSEKYKRKVFINLPFTESVKVAKMKNVGKKLSLKNSYSLYPNLLLNGVDYYVQRQKDEVLIIGTMGLAYESVLEIINYYRYKEEKNYNLVFVMDSIGLDEDFRFIYLDNNSPLEKWLEGQTAFENFIKSLNKKTL